jgi:hypothetical protein
MSDITGVRINRFELKRTDVDDPVAAKVSWDPAVGGGANFRTHKLKVTPARISVERSKGMIVFGGLFVLLGLAPAAIGVSMAMDGDWLGAVICILFGGVFSAVGGFSLSGKNLLTFDRVRGVYFRGGAYVAHPRPDRQRQGKLSDIHALQLISETVSGSKGGSFTSYELNVVFEDGERMNVMDHGDGAQIEASAKQLATFLSVPVWQAVY